MSSHRASGCASEDGAAAVGERVATFAARPPAADAIGVGEREQEPRVGVARTGFAAARPARRLQLPLESARGPAHPLERGTLAEWTRRLAAQQLEPCADVGIACPGGRPEQVALGKQRRELRGDGQAGKRTGAQQHVRQTRVDGEPRHLAPVGADPSAGIERAEAPE